MAVVVKNLPANAGDARDVGSIPDSGKSPEGEHGNPLQYSCLENPHGQRSLAGYSPQGRKESDMTGATWQALIQVCAAILIMGNQQGLTLLHREFCSMLCGRLDGRGVWGRMDSVFVWLSPFAVHLKLLQHCSSAILQYKIVFKQLKNDVYILFIYKLIYILQWNILIP